MVGICFWNWDRYDDFSVQDESGLLKIFLMDPGCFVFQ
jgi:hypothetical protein